jgi:hypothetical protein
VKINPTSFIVHWIGDVTGSCSIERDQATTWDYVRRYINDNCFGDGQRPGTKRIHVRPRFRARFDRWLTFLRALFFLFDPQLKLPHVEGGSSKVRYDQEVDYMEEIGTNNPTSKTAPLLVEVDKADNPVAARRSSFYRMALILRFCHCSLFRR